MKTFEVVAEIVVLSIVTPILLNVISIVAKATAVPPGSPFDVSGQMMWTLGIVLALIDITDIILLYNALKSDLGGSGR